MTTEKRIITSIYCVSFAGPFLSTALTVAIPAMAEEFAVRPDALSRMVTIFLITAAAALLPLGKIADIYGRRRIYTGALILFACSTGAASCAPSLTWLLCCYVLQGIALASVYVSYMPLLLTTVTPEHQGRRLGTAVSLTYLGLSSGPVLGGLLTQFISWRSIFMTALVLIAVSYSCIRPVRKEWYGNGAPFVNIVSTVLSAAAIILCLYGLFDKSPLLWLGIVFLAAFLLHERRSYHPILPLYIFRSLTFSMSTLAALIQYSATYAISFLMSLYAQLVLSLSPAMTGLLLLVQPLLMALLSRRTGALSDQYGSRLPATAGLVLTTGALTVFAVSGTPSLPLTVALLCLMGAGSALFGAPNNSAIMGAVKPALHGLAASMLALARNLGQAISMALVTLILTEQSLLVFPYRAAVLSTLHRSFSLFAVLCAAAAVASLIRGKP